MMTYKALFAQYKKELNQAITHYQEGFGDKSIPHHRAKDIVDIVGAIGDEHSDNEILKIEITTRIQYFKTGIHIFGFWLMATGKSKLKTGLEAVLQKPQYTHEAFLKAHIHELQLKVKALHKMESLDFSLQCEPKDLKKYFLQAQKTLHQLSQELSTLNKENTRLTQGIKELRAQNTTLYDANRDLRRTNISLQSRLDNTVEQEENIALAKSPSDMMYGSFKQFGMNIPTNNKH